MQAMNGGHGQTVPPLSAAAPDAEPEIPDEEDDSIDKEDA